MSGRISAILTTLESLLTSSKENRGAQTIVLGDLTPLAEQNGLNEEQVGRALEMALGGRLYSPESLTLLSLIYPLSPLTPSHILRIISILGEHSTLKKPLEGRVTYTVQKKALENLNIYWHTKTIGKEAIRTLESYWSVIESGLKFGSLRESTADLLIAITRPHHIQKSRIQSLKKLLNSLVSPPSSLFKLLELYQSFYPEFVLPQSRKRPSIEAERSLEMLGWSKRVEEIYHGDIGKRGESDEHTNKRRKLDNPTSLNKAPNTTHDSINTSTALSDLTTFPQLIDHYAKLVMPIQAGSTLTLFSESTLEDHDRVRIWGVLLRCGYGGNVSHLKRIGQQFSTTLARCIDEPEDDPAGSERVETLLGDIRDFCSIAGELMEEVELFLYDFLRKWDGKSHQNVIFDLIALHKPLSYDLFHARILLPLQLLSISAEALWLADLIDCLTRLVQNWAVRDKQEWKVSDSGSTLNSNGKRQTMFGELEGGVAHLRCLQTLCEEIDRLATVSLQTHPESILIRSSALSFYELSLSLPLQYGLAVVIVPSQFFTFSCLLSGEAMSFSRICGIIGGLRDTLTAQTSVVLGTDTTALVAHLNSFLIELINTIWMKKFLETPLVFGISSEEAVAIRKMCADRNQNILQSESLTSHGALAMMAKECLEEWITRLNLDFVPPTKGSITSSTLRDLKGPDKKPLSYTDFRVEFLSYLEKRGAKGVEKFLFSSLQSLMNRRIALNGVAKIESVESIA